MTWNIHWQTAFKSKDNKNYVVNIYEQDYSGNIVQLTPAEEPFITRENSSNDVFTVIRDQTGYLSVIVDDIATSGTTISHLLKTIRSLNDKNNITVFCLLGKNIEI